FAQQYPTKPVRVVLHLPAGGSTDVVTRILAQALTEAMGQPFVVENKLGADGAIAAAQVIQSPPDGYTLFVATNTPIMQVPLLKTEPPHDLGPAFTAHPLLRRSTLLPEVPTTVEAGMPPISDEFFAALFGPAKMPTEIATRLSKELNTIIAKPQIREQIDRQGFALAGSTPEELGAFVKQQLGAWSRGFRDGGINPA